MLQTNKLKHSLRSGKAVYGLLNSVPSGAPAKLEKPAIAMSGLFPRNCDLGDRFA
ncbi:MAG: hypothetical protein PSV18_10390 [Methylobacter sp.]|nr:hypothetical protein [Candidatus Methylobacter titanis]